MKKTLDNAGFTLIEVLLALAIIAIALTALIKATAQNVANTQRIQEKMISHWVAMQGVSMVQLGLLAVSTSQETTQITTMLGQRWYWRAKASPTPIKSVQQITITVSKNQAGPFANPLIAYRYRNE
ncbi:GspI family T2SS minor pseudopilin variant LspI [Legionella brunensis]|uniref:Type II secretion system protein I n=1 Tax=Legionella brunensis TaxID=29422 RepID=A0A0W0S5C3_9GAMM|nr:GspI family T2SS minor pseudopilin variant LspI [Legionella brunensis]KTC78260.1 type II secretory pathway protein LspI [Legionella brunensis]